MIKIIGLRRGLHASVPCGIRRAAGTGVEAVLVVGLDHRLLLDIVFY